MKHPQFAMSLSISCHDYQFSRLKQHIIIARVCRYGWVVAVACALIKMLFAPAMDDLARMVHPRSWKLFLPLSLVPSAVGMLAAFVVAGYVQTFKFLANVQDGDGTLGYWVILVQIMSALAATMVIGWVGVEPVWLMLHFGIAKHVVTAAIANKLPSAAPRSHFGRRFNRKLGCQPIDMSTCPGHGAESGGRRVAVP